MAESLHTNNLVSNLRYPSVLWNCGVFWPNYSTKKTKRGEGVLSLIYVRDYKKITRTWCAEGCFVEKFRECRLQIVEKSTTS